MKKPYTDVVLTKHTWIRTFDPTVTDSEEYVWHQDTETRAITVLEGVGWKFQFDDEMPFDININDTFTVPKMVYHRLIPNDSFLKILIEEREKI